MVSYSTELNGRKLDALRLTEKEAWEMFSAGFKFSIFDPTSEDYRLTAPYKMLHNIDRGTVTLQQP